VVVKSDYQRRGIGTEIISRLVSFIDEAAPYFVQVSPIGAKEVRLYEKFGFVVMPDYIRMERSTSKLREKIGAVRNRK
jgi:ribosomal protein S18 acetylase RimI-like enzyme